jgi:hypothetical protein
MRPKTIRWFEILYGAALVLLAIMSGLGWKYWAGEFGTNIAAFAVAFTFLLPLVLALLLSRLRSRVAKWLLVVHLALSFATYLPVLVYGAIPRIAIEQALAYVLQLTAITLLFTPSARAWLKGLRAPPVSPETLERTFE